MTQPMEKNVGGYDRIVRFVAGPLLVVVGLAALGGFITLWSGTLGVVAAAILALVGAVLLTTAATQKCPLNAALGMDTYSPKTASETGTDEVTEETTSGRPS